MKIINTGIFQLSDVVYSLKYHQKNRYRFLHILTKFHTKIIKNKKDTAKSVA